MLQLSVSTNLAAPMQAYKQLTRLQFLETTIKYYVHSLQRHRSSRNVLIICNIAHHMKCYCVSEEIIVHIAGCNALRDLDLKVMSFNLRTSIANDPCPSGCWEERKWRVKQLLERYEPDLIGTQEGAPDQIEFFQSQLSFASTGECAGDCQWNERNSIFYRLDRWELLETATFALSNTPAVLPSNTWGLEYLRAAVIARFRDKKINRVVCMLNTHFDIRLGHSQSAVLVAKQLSQRCQPEDTVLMTGDLNTGTQSSAVQYIIGQDPIDEGFTPIPMYETLTAASADGPTWIGSSFGNHVVGSKLDYIFSRRDNHTCLRTATILTDTFDGYSSSDHAVLLSKFCLGTECVGCIA
ncbi:unnamed protein product [Peronospora belbahrii]|uniref:Endonuclease/exonuclease/phosphatase domain-containing protein n=1 Tax=Peronospora belbahrii TaxID=622444 RepID=A0ABN8D5T3_9STRA|nr:unnamed protein product [Peronospora belbahrii]